MAKLGTPVTIVASGGLPVKQVLSGGVSAQAVASGGIAVTLTNRGIPMVIQGSTPTPTPTPIPSLVPVTTSSTLAGIPAATAQTYDPTDAATYPDEAYRLATGYFADFAEYTTMEASRPITVVCGDNVGGVDITLAGVTVAAVYAYNSTSNVWGWTVNIDCSASPNGWARLEAKITPAQGGIPRWISIPIHICGNPSGANWIPKKIVYVDGTNPVNGNGLTVGTPFNTLLAAVNSAPTSGGTSSKNTRWQFQLANCSKGELLWVSSLGEVGGVRRIFTYTPIFQGTTAGDPAVPGSGAYITIDNSGGAAGTWNAAPFGNRGENGMHALFRNVTIDLQDKLQKTRGSAFENCNIIDDYGRRRPQLYGYPAALNGSAANYGGLNRWIDGQSLSDRWFMLNCFVDMGECGTIHVRTNCTGYVAYDGFFVADLGNYVHYNDRFKQVGQYELNWHSGQYLEVASFTTGTFSSQPYTDVVFTAGPTLWNTGVDPNNSFLRVLEAADPAAQTSQTAFPQNPDGTFDYPYLGHRIGGDNSGASGWLGLKGWDSTTRRARIFGTPPLTVGDKVTAYVIGHGDMGQWANPARLSDPNRTNFTRRDCILTGHSWQPFLTGGGSIRADGGAIDAQYDNVTNVTLTTTLGSYEAVISVSGVPGYPSWLKVFDCLGYKPGPANTDHIRLVTKLIDPATGRVQLIEPFPTALTNQAIFACRSITGYSMINCILHKGSPRDEVGQIANQVHDFRIISSVIPGFTANGLCLNLRTNGMQSGGTGGICGLRIKDCIIRKLDTGGGSPLEQWPIQGYAGSGITTVIIENSHIDVEGSIPSAIPSGFKRGTVEIGTFAFGTGLRTDPWTANYVPSGTSMTVQTQTAAGIPVGTRIGSTLARI